MFKRAGLLAHALAFVSIFLLTTIPGHAQSPSPAPPSAASTGFYNIGIFISSDNDGCYIPGGVRAIRHFTTMRANEINQTGGINGRQLRLKFMDEVDNVKNTKRLVKEAVADPDMIAMIGLNSSTRGAKVVAEIGRSGIPLISEMSRSDLFAPYGNIFALTPAVEDELEVVKKFLENGPYARPVFIGQKGNLYVERISEALSDPTMVKRLAQSHWLPIASDYTIKDMAAVDLIIDDLVAAQADFLFLAIHSGPTAQLLARLVERDVKLPVYILLGSLGRIQQMLSSTPYPQDMYKSIRGNAPYVFNERLRQRIWKTSSHNWVFPSYPSPDPPAKCADKRKPKPLTGVNDPRNFRSINFAVRYRDMLDLIAEVAKTDTAKQDAKSVRVKIIDGLKKLKQGTKIHRGWWRNWSFTRHRAVAENAFVVHLDPKVGEMALAPTQYQLTPNGLKQVPVVYISLDMVRIFAVDSNEQSFQSEFYLSFKTHAGIDIDDIDFTNAFRSQYSRDTLLNIRRIHSRDGTGPLPKGLKLYKISGKFMFNPDLSRYPFDKQRFSISFQPSNAARPFIIQPPPSALAKSDFESDGWHPEIQYVGSDQDIISVIGDHVSLQTLIPLYKFNFTWTMSRIATDYYLRVLVPLIVILITTYLSVFIPARRLESVVAIQVTALLSSIALYLSVAKLNFEHATISDQIFVITYVAITLMLACSVIRVQLVAKEYFTANTTVKMFQVALIPFFILSMMGIVFAHDAFIDPVRQLFTWAGL